MTVSKKSRARRVLWGAAAAVPLLAMTVVPGSANAAQLGTQTITPSTGTEATYLQLDTTAKCPSGAATVQVRLTGPGMDTSDGNNFLTGTTSLTTVASNTKGGYSVFATVTLGDLWQQYGVLDPSGNYTVETRCSDSSGFSDLGGFLVQLKATPTDGNFKATYTKVTTPVVKKRFLVSKKPSLSGKAKVGKTLTCKKGTWKPAATKYKYKWLRDGKAIKKATKTTYVVKSKDKTHKLSCKVTGTRTGYVKKSVTSKAKTVK